jgi:hypothetical protein
MGDSLLQPSSAGPIYILIRYAGALLCTRATEGLAIDSHSHTISYELPHSNGPILGVVACPVRIPIQHSPHVSRLLHGGESCADGDPLFPGARKRHGAAFMGARRRLLLVGARELQRQRQCTQGVSSLPLKST